MSDPYTIDLLACRARQDRLVAQLERLELDAAVLTRRESVQWLTGAWAPRWFEPAAAISAEGSTTLVIPTAIASSEYAADVVAPYPAQRLATIRDDQPQAAGAELLAVLGGLPARVGGEFGYLNRALTESANAEWTDVSEVMLRLRRRKDPDELRMLARANQANRRMYEHAREILRPGINELDVYNELSAVAVRELGEALTYFGQDFQCNSPGGPPRDREAQDGELYILDLGVGFRGYFADNCRTFCLGSGPTDPQRRAWDQIAAIFPLVETTVEPGASCRDLYERVNSILAKSEPWKFGHHLGHGVGLAPHEAPRLNPHWDEHFEEGDYFTVEPGLYHEDLRGGIRLEQNYLVTSDGVQLLTDWPLELA